MYFSCHRALTEIPAEKPPGDIPHMQRDLNQLSSQTFDILVIGGGIQGSAIAWEASRRGLRTALIEKGDFGHATSANTLKIIHWRLPVSPESGCETHAGFHTRSKRVHAVGSASGRTAGLCHSDLRKRLRGKHPMRLALMANDVISWDRNRGLEERRWLPRGRVLGRDAGAKLFGISPLRKITGGALWYDGLALNTDRLLFAFVQAAHAQGACVANYLKADELGIEKERVSGVQATDQISEIRSLLMPRQSLTRPGPGLTPLFPPP